MKIYLILNVLFRLLYTVLFIQLKVIEGKIYKK